MSKQNYIVYPAILKKIDGAYTLTFPDFKNTAVFGHSLEEAFQSVPEYLAATLTSYKSFPTPTPIEQVQEQFPESTVTYYGLDTKAVRRKIKDVTVRKNVTIPMSLAEAAKEAGINFSETLTEALEEKLED